MSALTIALFVIAITLTVYAIAWIIVGIEIEIIKMRIRRLSK